MDTSKPLCRINPSTLTPQTIAQMTRAQLVALYREKESEHALCVSEIDAWKRGQFTVAELAGLYAARATQEMALLRQYLAS